MKIKIYKRFFSKISSTAYKTNQNLSSTAYNRILSSALVLSLIFTQGVFPTLVIAQEASQPAELSGQPENETEPQVVPQEISPTPTPTPSISSEPTPTLTPTLSPLPTETWLPSPSPSPAPEITPTPRPEAGQSLAGTILETTPLPLVISVPELSLWINNNGSYTSEKLRQGVTYRFPGNESVALVFTKLPENSGTVTIRENSVPQTMQNAGSKDYEITSTMENGSFEFDLTLPTSDPDKAVLSSQDGQNYSPLPNEKVVAEGVVIIKGLNHLTHFLVGGDPNNTEHPMINEFYSATSNDWVELYNPTQSSVDLAGWKLKDSISTTKVLSGTIPANGFLVFTWNVLNQDGDTVSLYNGSTLEDQVVYPETVAVPSSSQSAYRTTNGSGSWEVSSNITQGFTNENSTIYVDDSNTSGNEYGTQAYPFNTIQEGVNAVASGGTINVANGNYSENVVITNKSNLTLQASGNNANINPASGIGITLTSSSGVTIKGLRVATTGTNAHGIWVAGGPNGGSAVTNLTIQDNTITVDGYSSGVYSEQVSPAHSGWLIGGVGHGNTITINSGAGVTGDGMDLHDVSASEVSYNTITLNNPTNSTNVLWTSELSNLSALVFNNNIVSGSSGSEIAILTDFLDSASDTSISTVTISGNTFSNWGSRALRLGTAYGGGTVNGITLSSNTFNMTQDTTEVVGGTSGGSAAGTGNTFNVSGTAKIQKAIDAARTSDTINVSAGTYTEDLTIASGKTNLELSGTGSPTIKGVVTVPVANYPQAVPNIEILASGVKLHGFTIEGPGYSASTYASGMLIGAPDVEIYSNAFRVPTYSNGNTAMSNAIQTWHKNNQPTVDISGLNIHDNTFTGLSSENAGYEGIYLNLDTGTSIATIQNNVFTGNIFRAIATERSKTTISGNTITNNLPASGSGYTGTGGWQGINVGGANDAGVVTDISVSNNTITGSGADRGFSYGVKLGFNSINAFNGVSVVNNTIHNTGTAGIRVMYAANGILANTNNLSDNILGVKNEDATSILNAINNWWGSAVLTTIQSKVNDINKVTVVPYYVDLAKTILSSTAPTTVYVGSNYTDGNAGGHIFGYDAFTAIQEGINTVATNGTVNVAAGTYTEDLTIPVTKVNLNLVGAGSSTTTIKGVQNLPAASFPLAAPNIEVLADGVKIHGFTIEGPNPASGFYSSGVVIGGTNVEIYNNAFKAPNASNTDDVSQAIQTYRDGNNGAGDLSGLNIHDNNFTSLGTGTHGYEGIFINHTPNDPTPTNTVTINNNQFSGNILRGITTERSKTTISNNSIITDNLLANTFQGINIIDYGNREQKDISVTGNTIKGSIAGTGFSTGIRVGAGSNAQVLTNISITNNTIQNNNKGVAVRSSADSVVVNNNDISGNITTGLENITGTSTPVNAVNNWWGNTTGPTYASNPIGAGQSITDNVTYSPWYINSDRNVKSNDNPPTLASAYISGLTADANVSMKVTNIGTNATSISNCYYSLNNGTSWTAGSVATLSSDYYCKATGIDLSGKDLNNIKVWVTNNLTRVATTTPAVIDADAPSDLSAPTTTSNPTNSTSQTWTWTAATDPLSGIYGYWYRVTDQADQAVINSTFTNSLSVVTPLLQGIYNFLLKAEDNVSHQSNETSAILTVDTAAPNAPVITSIATDNKINNAEKSAIVVTGTAEANSLVNVTLSDGTNNVTNTQQLTNGATNFSITLNAVNALPASLTDGTITPSVTARDTTGNTSSPANTPTATQDTSPPTITVTSPLASTTQPTSFIASLTTNENATCSYSLDGAALSSMGSTGSLTHIHSFSNQSAGTHTIQFSCADAFGNTGTSSSVSFSILSSSGSTISATTSNANFSSTTSGQADLPSGVTTIALSDTTFMDLSASANANVVSGEGVNRSINVGGSPMFLSNFTSGTLAAVNLNVAQAIGGISVLVDRAVKLTSGTSGQPITLSNTSLSGVNVSIPDSTSILAPSGWNGMMQPPKTGSSTGVAPSGFLVGSTVIEVGSTNAVLLFDKPVVVTLSGVTGEVGYKPSGSTTWQRIATVCNDYNNPTNVSFPSECYVSNGTDTRIYTYHFTTFGSLNVAPVSSEGSIGGVSSLSASGAPVCEDTKPSSAPKLLSAQMNGFNEVTLTWSPASDPVTYYLVAYGTKSGELVYGNPDVGGKGTTSFTVKGLSGGRAYYFKVRAGNGCMPGDYSNELSASPLGVLIEGPAQGFQEGVLGEQESKGEIDGGVKATTTDKPPLVDTPKKPFSKPWALLVTLSVIVGGGYYLLRRRG